MYTENRYYVRHIHENMKSQFKGGRAKCDILLNNICEVFNRQLIDGRDQLIITCLEYIREYLMKMIVVVKKVIAKTIGPLTPYVTALFNDRRVYSCRKWELTRIPCKHVVAAIYNMSENGIGVDGGSSQAGARQAAGARNVSSQATGSRNTSSQATGSSQPSAAPSTTTDAKNASSQAAGSSQPSAAPSTTSQGPTQHSARPTQACQGPRQ
ncbi:mutator type transposase, partial [Tanacetum coccineum]